MRYGLPLGILLLVAFASVTAAETVTLVEDPAGDAVDAKAARACGDATSSACQGVATAAPPPKDRDLLGVTATFDATAMTLRMHLAEAADAPLPTAGDEALHYMACFDEGVCVMTTRGDETFSTGWIGRFDEDGCGVTGLCFWAAPMTVERGAPGALAFRVPLEALPADWAPERVVASVAEFETPAGDRWWMGPNGAVPVASHSGRSDTAEGPIANLPAFERPPLSRTSSIEKATPEGDAHAQADTTAFRWTETAESLVLEMEIASLVASPDVEFGTVVAVATSSFVRTLATAEHGEFEGVAYACQAEGQDLCARSSAIDIGFEAVPGTPGVLRWTLPRIAFGSPPAGTPVTIAWSWAMASETTSMGPLGTLETQTSANIELLPPFALALDTTAAAASSKAVVVDEIHDVASLPLLDPASTETLDITFVEAEGTAPDTSRVVLGIHDAASMTVPTGYDAAVYAVGFETEAGRFMVGLYQSDRAQEFFCAQDTLVFAEQRADPLQVARQAIRGAVSTASGSTEPSAGGQESLGGSITFYVPHTCFAQESDGSILAVRAAAGTYLLQNPTGNRATIELADDVAYPQAVVLEAASVVAAPAPWYANPFGIDSFYDITGVLLAVVASGVGVVAVRRKQNLLRRYLREVEAAAVLPSAKQRETALRDLHARAKHDVARGRLSDGHFVLVDRRIEAALAEARSALLRAAFGDMPARLLERLQAFLADGDMSIDEYRAFCSQLDGERLPLDVKEDMRRRVQAWVAEHKRVEV